MAGVTTAAARRLRYDVAELNALDGVATTHVDYDALTCRIHLVRAAHNAPLPSGLGVNASLDSAVVAESNPSPLDSDRHSEQECPDTRLQDAANQGGNDTFVFAVSVSQRYPFVRPVLSWLSKPSDACHPNLGPDGLVSADELTAWSPACSLAAILAALFPDTVKLSGLAATMAAETTSRPCSSSLKDASVLDALASYLARRNEVSTMKALHATCRTAAGAINCALRQLRLCGKTVHVTAVALQFPALEHLGLKHCSVQTEGMSTALRNNSALLGRLKSVCVDNCEVSLVGSGGLLAAAEVLTGLQSLKLQIREASVIPQCSGCNPGDPEPGGSAAAASEQAARLARGPAPAASAGCLWCSVARLTRLKSLHIEAHLRETLAPGWQSHRWTHGAELATAAFQAVGSLTALTRLAFLLHHNSAESGTAVLDDAAETCRWPLPANALLEFLELSGLAIGHSQVSNRSFWRQLTSLRLNGIMFTRAMRNPGVMGLVTFLTAVRRLDLRSLESAHADPAPPLDYSLCRNLVSLRTSKVSVLPGLPHLTRLELVDVSLSSAVLFNVRAVLAELRHLELHDCSGCNGPSFEALRAFTQLTKLRVTGNPPLNPRLAARLLPGVALEHDLMQPSTFSSMISDALLSAHRPILSPFMPAEVAATGGAMPAWTPGNPDVFRASGGIGYQLGVDSHQSAPGAGVASHQLAVDFRPDAPGGDPAPAAAAAAAPAVAPAAPGPAEPRARMPDVQPPRRIAPGDVAYDDGDSDNEFGHFVVTTIRRTRLAAAGVPNFQAGGRAALAARGRVGSPRQVAAARSGSAGAESVRRAGSDARDVDLAMPGPSAARGDPAWFSSLEHGGASDDASAAFDGVDLSLLHDEFVHPRPASLLRPACADAADRLPASSPPGAWRAVRSERESARHDMIAQRRRSAAASQGAWCRIPCLGWAGATDSPRTDSGTSAAPRAEPVNLLAEPGDGASTSCAAGSQGPRSDQATQETALSESRLAAAPACLPAPAASGSAQPTLDSLALPTPRALPTDLLRASAPHQQLQPNLPPLAASMLSDPTELSVYTRRRSSPPAPQAALAPAPALPSGSAPGPFARYLRDDTYRHMCRLFSRLPEDSAGHAALFAAFYDAAEAPSTSLGAAPAPPAPAALAAGPSGAQAEAGAQAGTSSADAGGSARPPRSLLAHQSLVNRSSMLRGMQLGALGGRDAPRDDYALRSSEHDPPASPRARGLEWHSGAAPGPRASSPPPRRPAWASRPSLSQATAISPQRGREPSALERSTQAGPSDSAWALDERPASFSTAQRAFATAPDAMHGYWSDDDHLPFRMLDDLQHPRDAAAPPAALLRRGEQLRGEQLRGLRLRRDQMRDLATELAAIATDDGGAGGRHARVYVPPPVARTSGGVSRTPAFLDDAIAAVQPQAVPEPASGGAPSTAAVASAGAVAAGPAAPSVPPVQPTPVGAPGAPTSVPGRGAVKRRSSHSHPSTSCGGGAAAASCSAAAADGAPAPWDSQVLPGTSKRPRHRSACGGADGGGPSDGSDSDDADAKMHSMDDDLAGERGRQAESTPPPSDADADAASDIRLGNPAVQLSLPPGAMCLDIVAPPLCPAGHKTNLLLQINAQATPQWAHLGPYLLRVSVCPSCSFQVPSMLDLTQACVRGTCTDSFMVVSDDLQARMVKAMQSRGLSRVGPHNEAAADGQWRLRHVSCPLHGSPRAPSSCASDGDVQTANVMFVSGWTMVHPHLESPPVGDVHAMCQVLGLQAQPYEQRVSDVTAKLGGYTWLAASPMCQLCHNRMHAVISVPCKGNHVVAHTAASMVLQLFKCPLHPSEMQCVWVVPSRPSRPAPRDNPTAARG